MSSSPNLNNELKAPTQAVLRNQRAQSKYHSRTASLLTSPLAFLTSPNSLAASWTALRDHNLRTGIPNLEQLLCGKGRPPLDIHSFSNYVEREEPIGGLLLDFYKRVVQFENHCIAFEEKYPLPPTVALNATDGSSLLGSVKGGRTLVVQPNMEEKEKVDLEELASEAYQLILDFLDPGSSRFVGCPHEFVHRACTGLEAPGQPWPTILSSAKQYVFNTLNQCFYQDFVDYCFKRNLTAISSQISLMVGSFFFVFGLTFSLSLIFHSVPQYAIRIAMFPFVFIGHIFLLSAYSRFFPLLGFMRSRESTFRKLEPLVEPLVLKSHRRRASIHILVGMGVSFLITLIFCLIPGYHLQRSV